MERRHFLKQSTIGMTGLIFTPAQIFAESLFYTEDAPNIINMTPYGPIPMVNIITFFSKVVKGISAAKTIYDTFKTAHGLLNSSNKPGWQPQYNDLYDYSRFWEIAYPTYRHDATLYSGSNNYMMPVVSYNNGLQPRAYVGGPHLVGLGMLCEGTRQRTSSAQETANRIFPKGQSSSGNFTFTRNSYSNMKTAAGDIGMHYQNHGGGKGSITAEIARWDSDVGRNVKDNVNVDVRYS